MFAWLNKLSRMKYVAMNNTLEKWIQFDPEHRDMKNLNKKRREKCFLACKEYLHGKISITYNYGKHFD